MKFIRHVLLFTWLSFAAYADGEPLEIGTESFSPPFVMQAGMSSLYGFDVSMMNSLCNLMQRKCNYHLMKFKDLIPAVVDKKIDIALSSITITPERSQIVSFSLPYLPSNSRFLVKKRATDPQMTLNDLNNKVLGVEQGTVFQQQFNRLGLKNTQVKEYDNVSTLLEALNTGAVDYIVLENPTALYWQSNTENKFLTVGPPFLYGYGLGIAVSQDSPDLLKQLNDAILRYQASDDFVNNYNKYFHN